jgi:hypothetical protein
LGADVRRSLRSTTYTPPSPQTGIEMGPMTADGKDGDPMPPSRPRERKTQSEPNTKERSIPKIRHEASIHPSHPSTDNGGPAKRKLARKSPDAGTSTCLSRPVSLVLASQTPASPRPVPPCPSQSTTPPIRRCPNLFPSIPPSACFLSATCLSHPPAMGAGPLTRPRRRSMPDRASLQRPARPFRLPNRSRVAESAATRCRTDRRYLSPASTPHLSRPRRRRWETASSRLPPNARWPPPRDDGDAGT